ncbi:MAG TPA: DUF2769 domain-containing protein [Methanoregulaceae archaeon]|nr:DUF2769 domain-containing protein [Methanoregulaceae archaeon]
MNASDTPAGTMGGNPEQLRQECICPECPTYTPCARDAQELLYCVAGRSPRCITEDLGCICPTCPVADRIGLEHLTFCLLGSEAAQRAGRDAR